jgi:hypothetical protein
MPLEPWHYMTRSDVEAMWKENAALRYAETRQRRWREQTKVLLAVALVVIAVSVGLTAFNLWAVLR